MHQPKQIKAINGGKNKSDSIRLNNAGLKRPSGFSMVRMCWLLLQLLLSDPTQPQGWQALGLVVSGSLLCFMEMKWFCCFHRAMTSSLHRGSLKLSVPKIRITTSKSAALVFRQKRVECPHQTGDELLP